MNSGLVEYLRTATSLPPERFAANAEASIELIRESIVPLTPLEAFHLQLYLDYIQKHDTSRDQYFGSGTLYDEVTRTVRRFEL